MHAPSAGGSSLFQPNFWKMPKKDGVTCNKLLFCLWYGIKDDVILPVGKFCAQQHKKLLAARQTPARHCYKDDS